MVHCSIFEKLAKAVDERHLAAAAVAEDKSKVGFIILPLISIQSFWRNGTEK